MQGCEGRWSQTTLVDWSLQLGAGRGSSSLVLCADKFHQSANRVGSMGPPTGLRQDHAFFAHSSRVLGSRGRAVASTPHLFTDEQLTGSAGTVVVDMRRSSNPPAYQQAADWSARSFVGVVHECYRLPAYTADRQVCPLHLHAGPSLRHNRLRS